jgi:hypothetical protein
MTKSQSITAHGSPSKLIKVELTTTSIVILYLNQRETPILLVYTLDSPPVHNMLVFTLRSYIVQAMQVIYFWSFSRARAMRLVFIVL